MLDRDTQDVSLHEAERDSILARQFSVLQRQKLTFLEGVRLASDLREAAEEHDDSAFILPICIALASDFTIVILDGVALTVYAAPVAVLLEFLTGLVCSIILFIFFWGRGTWKIKLILWLAGLLKILPLPTNIIPWETLSVIYVWYELKNESEEKREEAELIEEALPSMSDSIKAHEQKITSFQRRNR